MPQLKGAFPGCKWCYGTGCLQCDKERAKAHEKALQPIFSADLENPDDVALLKETFGVEALDHAFGPDGEGMREVERNAAFASLRQIMRKGSKTPVTKGQVNEL